ncbi:hypothetical protein LTR99_000981 [Exophiala xenobiotica]|uniref:Uncharacterized protein n=1 Tax=Vermiconidia calcicola TaxID=1690605 RepID=A0AAV9QNB0_9PEZI|nr:hypothetical protein LTR96_003687 [Exophiala xenobiotica]KAK5540674.1 hypothetical protein LTR23_005905 [Chaetothyriales sp. CCFEE 6169]KAK5545544.1 hypothetical protein LTR25_000551 [Vermiconidia calcicola]KAK5308009.1 hypothetical protein LTR99_000981 [Exophiala xenobiotica]KAK5343093.1 hypothetical protein LTR98_000722 [Exophiala xenobiotica]
MVAAPGYQPGPRLVLELGWFGGWYSWYMRRRRNRNSLSHDHYDANAPTPGMSEYGGNTGGRSGMGAMAAVAGYSSNRSDTRSELPSPPLNPPPRSPDRLLPIAAGIRSWGSVSPPPHLGSSGMSVSEQSEYSQGHTPHQHPQAGPVTGAAGEYFSNLNELPEDQREIHQLPDGQAQPQLNERNLAAGYGPPAAATGAYSQDESYHPSHSSAQESYELPGGQDTNAGPPAEQGRAGYRGVDPEVPLHQRYERVPIRPGHLGPSHNF